MNFQPIRVVAVFCLSLWPQFSSGQPVQNTVNFEFSCVAFEELPFDLYYKSEDAYEKIAMRPKQRSRLYKLKTAAEIVPFYTQETDEDGKIAYRVVGQAKIITTAERMLFFLSPVEIENQLPIKAVGVDDSLDAFPVGSFRFVNMTRRSLRAVIDDANVLIAPGTMRIIDPEIPEAGGFVPFYIGDELDQKILLKTLLYSQPRGREMLFITIDSAEQGSDRIQVQYLSETVPSALTNRD